VVSYPDFEASPALLSEMAALRCRYGVVLVRQLLAPEQVASLRLIGNLTYAVGDALHDLPEAGDVPPVLLAGLRRHGWIPWTTAVEWLRVFALHDCPRMVSLIETVQQYAAGAFGADARLLDVSTFRRHLQGAPVSRVPWHRDFAVVKTSPFGEAVNFWIPLVEVGVDTPSLEVVIGSHEVMREIPEPPGPELEDLDDDWVDANLSGLTRWIPHCRPGDVLMFDHHVVHRTQWVTEILRDRMSVELRWTPVEKPSPQTHLPDPPQ
jgi:hypothetical protein